MSEILDAHRVASRDYSKLRASLLSYLSKSTKPARYANARSASLKSADEDGRSKEGQRGFDWEVKANKLPLWILGLWPSDSQFENLKFILCLILILIYSLPSIVRIIFIGTEGSIDRPVQIITEIIPLIYTIVQFSIFKYKSSKVKIILTRIYEDWGHSVNLSEEDKKPMLLYGGRTRFITATCIGFFFVACIGYYTEPLLTMLIKEKAAMNSLPNKGLYPFDTNTSPSYEIVYATQAFIGGLCAISISGIDGFLMLSVFHGCGQLAVLCNIIGHYEGQTSHTGAARGDSKNKFESHHCSCLKCIVDRHVSLSNYAKIVDDVFNEIIMARLILNTIHFCGVGYIITESNEYSKFIDLLLNLLYMTTLMFNFFLYCWIGQQLLEEGENVGTAVYKLNWHKEKPTIARSFILPILHSTRPLKVTAGRFFIMSLSCFKEWFMNSVGYLSVLLAIKTHT